MPNPFPYSDTNKRYHTYDYAMRKRFGGKCIKIPLDGGFTCPNIDGTKGRIESMLDTICIAYEKQLDALFGEEALDISTDITVMEQMLAREGLGGLNIKDEKKDDEGGIRLGL